MKEQYFMFLEELKARGFVFDISDEKSLQARLQTSVTLYAGFDATASSFHVGHLMLFVLLRYFQRHGHRVIALLGGGTTRIGDPSDKKSARPLMDEADIQKNATKLRSTLSQLLNQGELLIVNNDAWLSRINYLDFLRDIGRYFSVNRLLSFDFVKSRIQNKKPLSFLELNYILLQSYDYLELHDRHGCCLQIGGQDQWANILSGVELVRKAREKEVFAFTCPLLTTASGHKMGKTAQGAVWLDKEKLSPYEFWQFWRNTDDADVLRFLRLFSELPLEVVEKEASKSGKALNEAKKMLADSVTALVHGKEGLEEAHQQTACLFAGKEAVTQACFSVERPCSLIEVLERTQLVSSRSEARRMIRSGAVRLNGVVQQEENKKLVPALFKGTPLKLSVGKKRHVLLRG